MVDLVAAAMSKPWAIAYSSEANTDRVTLLHLVEDQWRIFADPFLSVSARTYPIWDEKSLLFANEASVKTKS